MPLPNLHTMLENLTLKGLSKLLIERSITKNPLLHQEIPSPDAPSSSNSFDLLSNLDMLESDPSNIVKTTSAPSTKPFVVPTPNDASQPSLATNSDPQPIASQPIPLPDYNKALWSTKGMDIDNLLTDPLKTNHHMDESCQQSHMDEEPESFDLGDLDISSLEQACKKKEFDKIPDRQLENLEVVLSRVHQHRTLGIQQGSSWDGKHITKDANKIGRKTDLQCTILIGEMLVESGRCSKLTKYYRSLPIGQP